MKNHLRTSFFRHNSDLRPLVTINGFMLLMLTCGATSTLALDPTTLPAGAKVVSGSGAITASGSSMTINQASDKLITNWDRFSIGSAASVRFNQPGSSSSALNRVTGADVSQIAGQLASNGRVLLLNPNGVLFSPTSRVNVGGLVASTLNLADQDYLSGNYSFNGSGGTILNQGSITSDGGVVAFLAPTVTNQGTIMTPGGTTALLAGKAMTLDFHGDGLLRYQINEATASSLASNSGTIRANDGMVILSAQTAGSVASSVVNNSGIIEARGLVSRGGKIILDSGSAGQTTVSGVIDTSSSNATGGDITVLGEHITINNSARVEATGSTGGGTILVGGSWQNSDPSVRQALTTTIESGAFLDASATGNGDGGMIVAWSDVFNPNSVTSVKGTLLARGGASGGNGGRIETSGYEINFAGVTIDAGAPAGLAGEWLIDPDEIIIEESEEQSIEQALETTDVTVATADQSSSVTTESDTSSADSEVIASIDENAETTAATEDSDETAAPVTSETTTKPVIAEAAPAVDNNDSGLASQTLPTGGSIQSGSGGISISGSSMTINQSSDKLIANWDSFSIGSDASVRFNQPSIASSALNRVVGSDVSQIAGQLSSNGRVLLINPHGVIFSPTAHVNVGGLFTSTHALADQDYLSDRFIFGSSMLGAEDQDEVAADGSEDIVASDTSEVSLTDKERATADTDENTTADQDIAAEISANEGFILNQGSITTANGGVVAFVAPNVSNEGVIETAASSTMLLAGEGATIDFDGDGLITYQLTEGATAALAANSGTITADGGMVVLSSKGAGKLSSSVVNNSGVVEAKGSVTSDGKIILESGIGGMTTVGGTLDVSSELSKGGRIEVTGERIMVESNAKLDATGKTGGGDVLIGGDWQGSGELQQATTVTMESGATIDASATENGDGGKVVLWSDITNPESLTIVKGSIRTTGGTSGGDGGHIETSGGQLQIADSIHVDTTAMNGLRGLWLLDPQDITVAASGGSVTGATIATALKTTDVTLDTGGEGSCSGVTCGAIGGKNGDIFINDDIITDADLGATRTLTFKANRNIAMQAGKSIDATAGGNGEGLNVVFWADADASNDGQILLNDGSSIKTNGGNLVFAGGADGNGDDIPDGYASAAIPHPGAGVYFKFVDIATSGGDLLIRGSGTGGPGIWIDNGSGSSSFSTGAGDVTIEGIATGAGSVYGLENLHNAATLQTTSGDISIKGTGSFTDETSFVSGLKLNKMTIQSTSGGDILLEGIGGDTARPDAWTDIANGIDLNETNILSDSGTITLNGVAGSQDGTTPYGIRFHGNSYIGQKAASDVTTSTSDINIITDSLYIEASNRISSSGTLTVKPKTGGTSIGLASGTGALELTAGHFSTNFVNGFSLITIGDAAAGTITLGTDALTYSDPLALKSAENITAVSNASLTGGVGETASLILWADADSSGDGRITLNSGTSIDTNGGGLWMGGSSGTNSSGTTTWNGITVGDGYATSTGGSYGILFDRTTIDTAGGDLNAYGLFNDAGQVSDTGLYVTASSLTSNGGNITLEGVNARASNNVNDKSSGIEIDGYGDGTATGTTIASGAGNIAMLGKLNPGITVYEAVGLNLGTKFSWGGGATGDVSIASTTGSISLQGDSRNVDSSNNRWVHGLVLEVEGSGDDLLIQSGTGNINLIGQAGGGAGVKYAHGMSLQTKQADANTSIKVVSTGNGDITLNGDTNADESSTNHAGISLQSQTNAGAGTIWLGYDESNAYNGKVSLVADSFYLRNNQWTGDTGVGAVNVLGAGSFEMTSNAASFARSLTFVTSDVFDFGTSLTGFTVGKSTNTADLILDNRIVTSGTFLANGGDITAVNSNNDFTGTASVSGATIALRDENSIVVGASSISDDMTVEALSGDVTLSGNITKDSGTDATATFKATGNVTQNTSVSISSSSNKLNTILWADSDATNGGNIRLGQSAPITTNGGHLWLGGGSGSTTWNGLTVGDGYAQGTTALAHGIYLDSGTITTGGGNIAMYGKSAVTGTYTTPPDSQSNASGIYSSFNNQFSINSGTGSIYLNAVGQNKEAVYVGDALYLNGGSMTSAASSGDAITLIGDASSVNTGSSSRGAGISILGWNSSPKSNTISATGGGHIVLTGTSTTQQASKWNPGVRISGYNNITTSGGSGNITITGTTTDLTAENSSVRIETDNDRITTAGNLLVNGTGMAIDLGASRLTVAGTTTLTAAGQNITANNVNNDFTGTVTVTGANIALRDSNAMSLGAINSTGTVEAATLSGNLTLTDAISTSNATASAITLNAASNTAAGTATGGNIIVSGGSVSVGAGGRATLYSGSVSNSTGLTALVGSGSGKFRYNSDESFSGFSTALGTGTYGVYREQPTLIYTGDDETITYGASHSATATLSGLQNGDTSGQAISTAATVAVGGTTSNSGKYTAGSHTLTPSGAAGGLGYTFSYTAGTLTINQLNLNVTGLSANDKVYDGNTVATLTGTGAVSPISGDVVTVGGTTVGAFADANVGNDKAVTVTGNTITGADAGNYNLIQQAGLTADITPEATPPSISSPESSLVAVTSSETTTFSTQLASLPLAEDNISAIDVPLDIIKAIEVPLDIVFTVFNRDFLTNEAKTIQKSKINTFSQEDQSITDLIMVQLIDTATPSSDGYILVSVPDQKLLKGVDFEFPMPRQLTVTGQKAEIIPTILTAEGLPLPAWLNYDPASGLFKVSGAGFGSIPLKLRVEIGEQSWLLEIVQTETEKKLLTIN